MSEMNERPDGPPVAAPRQSNTGKIVLIVVLALVLLCGCLAVLAAVAAGLFVIPARNIFESRGVNITIPGDNRIHVDLEQTQSFNVQAPVLVTIQNDVGDIRVTSEDTNQVTVRVTVRGFGSTTENAQNEAERVKIEMQQQADGSIHLLGDNPTMVGRMQSPMATWVVTVPRECRVEIKNGVGAVLVRDVRGTVDLSSDVGDVRAQNLTMTGDSALTCNVGSIEVSLPADSSFRVDAATDTGEIEDDFNLPRAEEKGFRVGDKLTGTVGNDPAGTLTLRSDVGRIRILAER